MGLLEAKCNSGMNKDNGRAYVHVVQEVIYIFWRRKTGGCGYPGHLLQNLAVFDD